MEKISFNFPIKSEVKDRTEREEVIRLLCELLNKGLPREYVDKMGKKRIAKKFTLTGLHFKLVKLSDHRVKQIKASCEQSNNPSLTFNFLTKDVKLPIRRKKLAKIPDNF